MADFFSILGLVGVVWWVTGVVLFTFSNIYIARGSPWQVKLKVVIIMGWVTPFYLLTRGHLPIVAVQNAKGDEEEKRRFQEWLAKDDCPCPACKARRRGE